MSPTGSGTPRRLFSVALVPQPKCAAVDVARPVGIRTDIKHPATNHLLPHADSKTFIVALGLSGAPACAEDTGCVADAKVYGNSVVQLADPIDGGYCTGKELVGCALKVNTRYVSRRNPLNYIMHCIPFVVFRVGTLIRGPGNRNFILTARHCHEMNKSPAANPLSSHVALFNYRVLCNTTRDYDLAHTFSDFLQVGSMVGRGGTWILCGSSARRKGLLACTRQGHHSCASIARVFLCCLRTSGRTLWSTSSCRIYPRSGGSHMRVSGLVCRGL